MDHLPDVKESGMPLKVDSDATEDEMETTHHIRDNPQERITTKLENHNKMFDRLSDNPIVELQDLYTKQDGNDPQDQLVFEDFWSYEDDSVCQPGITLLKDKLCRKNPNHEQFIPIQSFGIHHIPNCDQAQFIFENVQTLAKLTVKVTVSHVSIERPESVNGTSYPNYKFRGQSGKKCWGTGRVSYVKKYSASDDKPCPCSKCKQSSPLKEWVKIVITTAKHVVFDSDEAQNTVVQFGYDSHTSKEIFFWGISAEGHIENDLSSLTCSTHELNLADDLEKLVDQYNKLKLEALKYKIRDDEMKISIIVSHPHGFPKHVSVGKWVDRTLISKKMILDYEITKDDGETIYHSQEFSGSDSEFLSDDDWLCDYENNGDANDLYLKNEIFVKKKKEDKRNQDSNNIKENDVMTDSEQNARNGEHNTNSEYLEQFDRELNENLKIEYETGDLENEKYDNTENTEAINLVNGESYTTSMSISGGYHSSKYRYTASTCSGSSGATVFIFVRDDWRTDHTHSKCESLTVGASGASKPY